MSVEGIFREGQRRLHSRLNRALFAQKATSLLQAYCFLFGSFVAILHLAFPLPLLWAPAVAGVVIVLIAAFALSRRRFYSDGETLALLDKRSAADGLFLAAAEADASAWNDLLRQKTERIPPPPVLRWSGHAARLFLPALFLGGSFFVPERESEQPSYIRYGAARVEETAKALEEIKALEITDEKQTEQWEEELKRLAREAEERPLTSGDLEALDAIREKIARENAENRQLAEWGDKTGEALTKALEDPKSVEQDLEQARKEAEEFVNELGRNGKLDKMLPGLREQLEKMGARNADGRFDLSRLDPNQLREFSRAMGGDLRERMADLAKNLEKQIAESGEPGGG